MGKALLGADVAQSFKFWHVQLATTFDAKLESSDCFFNKRKEFFQCGTELVWTQRASYQLAASARKSPPGTGGVENMDLVEENILNKGVAAVAGTTTTTAGGADGKAPGPTGEQDVPMEDEYPPLSQDPQKNTPVLPFDRSTWQDLGRFRLRDTFELMLPLDNLRVVHSMLAAFLDSDSVFEPFTEGVGKNTTVGTSVGTSRASQAGAAVGTSRASQAGAAAGTSRASQAGVTDPKKNSQNRPGVGVVNGHRFGGLFCG